MSAAVLDQRVDHIDELLPPVMPVVVDVCQLVKDYGEVRAVDGVSLQVRKGEVFGFLGPNGAGKTTTIGMILGVIAPTSGRVRLFGQELRGNEKGLLSRVGSLIEVPTFYPYLGARDNLKLLARLDGRIGRDRIEEVLETTQLTGAAHRPFKTYSLGMKQRLGIAAALLCEPELVVLDEPTNGLDPMGIVEVRGLLRRLADEGRAVMLSSHQLNEVQRICDRVAIVSQGRIVAEGAVGDLLAEQRHVRVTVSELERGADVARALSWVTRVELESGAIAVYGAPPHPFALSQALARSGIWIGQMVRPDASLERYFLTLTQAGIEASRNGVRTKGLATLSGSAPMRNGHD